MNKSVMKCCICNNENIGQFITINNKKYHLCCIEQLQQENQQLKDNWIKLKECLKDVMNSCDADDKDFLETILDIMQELEQGSDNK